MTTHELMLSVNVDHVATLRQARRATYPDPVEAARLAEDAGATGITAHLREDRRHIQEEDIAALKAEVRGRLNLEIAATEAMLRVATLTKPDQVTLVPERPDEITTEGGLDVLQHGSRIQRAATTLANAGIRVSVFVDPEDDQISRVGELRDVEGFEINTDVYSKRTGDERAEVLAKIRRAATLGAAAGLQVYAGHGLTCDKVAGIASVPEISELNIGHAIVSRAVLVGMTEAVREMLAAIGDG